MYTRGEHGLPGLVGEYWGLVAEGENMELPSGEKSAPPASGDIMPGDMKAACRSSSACSQATPLCNSTNALLDTRTATANGMCHKPCWAAAACRGSAQTARMHY
jgi:hypothetical protein